MFLPYSLWAPHLAHWGWGPRALPVRAHISYATGLATMRTEPHVTSRQLCIYVLN
jgi:hypothetical protein